MSSDHEHVFVLESIDVTSRHADAVETCWCGTTRVELGPDPGDRPPL